MTALPIVHPISESMKTARCNVSPLFVTLQDGLERLFEVIQSEEFLFIVNGEESKSTIAEAVLLSPTIHQQLRSCPDLRTFRITDERLTATDFSRFLDFVRSRILTGFAKEEQTSFLSICGLLGNSRLTFLLLESLHGIEEDQEVCEIDADVCSAKFSDYSNEVIKRVEKGMLHEILSSPELKLENEDAFLKTLISLGTDYFEFWEYIEVNNLTVDGITLFVDNLPFDELTESIWKRITDRLRCSKPTDLNGVRYRDVPSPSTAKSQSSPKQPPAPSPATPQPSPQQPPPPPFDSRIISDFPEIFAEFRGKHFEILWRGSSDGFEAQEFHRRCDGHANTLTVILDTEGNIFGGFTPVKWESRTIYKADDSLKSFLFTLKNPHSIPARRFALKAEKKHQAIICDSERGPSFCDIYVSDNCNANTSSCTYLGGSYTNDTGLDAKIVFTGSWNFRVQEIEVFEITA